MSLKESLREANIGNDDLVGDNPEATLGTVRALREGAADRTHQERQEAVESAASDAPRISVRALTRKLIGSGKPVADFKPPEPAELGNASEFPDAPHGEAFQIPDVEPAVTKLKAEKTADAKDSESIAA